MADDVRALAAVLAGRRVAALTGAGISTESGIPDYRGPETRRRAHRPLQHAEFARDPEARRRYWARSAIGWPRIDRAQPNAAHRAVVALEGAGVVTRVVTQNVDRLHQRAGSRRVIELHGALAEVRCRDCGAIEARASVQTRLLARNPGWLERTAELAPDGDAELPATHVDAFQVVECAACGGVLAPAVVMFGGSVPREIVDAAYAAVEAADALLVIGSSLAVFSGYRFVRRAADRGMPIAIVNLGESRGDALATVRVDRRAGEVLPLLADALGAGSAVTDGA